VSDPKTSVLDQLTPSDSHCIDAAAHAWINAGGDAESVQFQWQTLAARVAELINGKGEE